MQLRKRNSSLLTAALDRRYTDAELLRIINESCVSPLRAPKDARRFMTVLLARLTPA
jgi:hypothetical protein